MPAWHPPIGNAVRLSAEALPRRQGTRWNPPPPPPISDAGAENHMPPIIADFGGTSNSGGGSSSSERRGKYNRLEKETRRQEIKKPDEKKIMWKFEDEKTKNTKIRI